MAVYTVRNISACTNLCHAKMDIYRDGSKIANRVFDLEQLLTKDLDLDDVVFFLLREAVKSAGATTPSQAKAAIEAKEWVL